MNPQPLRIAAGALELEALVYGDPGAPAVLALHGWLDNAASFAALAPLIPGVRVIALDLPGHGHSAHRPAGVWYHYVDYVSDVLAAADALGLARFTLLGHSLGGAVASVIAAAAPDRVEALWLIEGLGPLSYPAEEALKHLRMGLSERSEAARKQLRVFPDVATAIAARRQAGGLSEAAASALVLRGIEACDGGWRWSSDPRLTVASPLRISETQIHAMLAGIECPTLLVLADPPAPYLATERMAQRVAQVKSIESVRIAGSHHLHLEDPQPVADAIAQFRRGLVGAA